MHSSVWMFCDKSDVKQGCYWKNSASMKCVRVMPWLYYMRSIYWYKEMSNPLGCWRQSCCFSDICYVDGAKLVFFLKKISVRVPKFKELEIKGFFVFFQSFFLVFHFMTQEKLFRFQKNCSIHTKSLWYPI